MRRSGRSPLSAREAVMDQILDPYRHAARRITRQILETEPPIGGAHVITERVRDHAEAADHL